MPSNHEEGPSWGRPLRRYAAARPVLSWIETSGNARSCFTSEAKATPPRHSVQNNGFSPNRSRLSMIPFAFGVIDRDRPHPVEPREDALPPFEPALQQHLGVTARAERPALGAQLLAHLDVVVDLAIQDDAPLGRPRPSAGSRSAPGRGWRAGRTRGQSNAPPASNRPPTPRARSGPAIPEPRHHPRPGPGAERRWWRRRTRIRRAGPVRRSRRSRR